MSGTPRFRIAALEFFERDVKLRMPFRFGIVTLKAAPQAFVRATIELENGKSANKDPSLTNEQNFAQLRASLVLARDSYLADASNTAFGHSIETYGPQIAIAATQGMNNLVACYGPALIDRAVLDALCRALEISFFRAMQKNIAGIAAPGWQADLQAFDMDEFLLDLSPKKEIAARHTVGLLDPIRAADLKEPVGDGLPETLEQVIERYGHRWFKLKVGGDAKADVDRLSSIAAVLDVIKDPYYATLDGNEQYHDVEGALALWRAIKSAPRLKRLAASVVFIEQPIKRQIALAGDVSELAEEKPVIIDESDDSLEAFPRARRLGYSGVSSKTCKGLYKSILNAARCLWNREEGSRRFFMSGEDLTIQAGLALQQDLALVSLLGITHVERNGHHYVNGMAGLPEAEQVAFLDSHPDVYERSHGSVRLRIKQGMISMSSLTCPGYASAALPDWNAMRKMP